MKTINVRARMPQIGVALYFDGTNHDECRTFYPELYYEGEENNRSEDQRPTNGRVRDVCCKNTWIVITPENHYWMLDDFMFKRIYYDVDAVAEMREWLFPRSVGRQPDEETLPSPVGGV